MLSSRLSNCGLGVCATNSAIVSTQADFPTGQASNCSDDSNCNTLCGGIGYAVVTDCSSPLVADPTNIATWNTQLALNDGSMRIWGGSNFVGSKAKGSPNRIRKSSCSPPSVNSILQTITIKDYCEDKSDMSKAGWYNFLMSYAGCYALGFFTCEGMFLGFLRSVDFFWDVIIPEESENPTYYELEVQYFSGGESWLDLSAIGVFG